MLIPQKVFSNVLKGAYFKFINLQGFRACFTSQKCIFCLVTEVVVKSTRFTFVKNLWQKKRNFIFKLFLKFKYFYYFFLSV